MTLNLRSFTVGAMSPRSDFYQSHLDRVSRSFALCIRQLPEPLQSWVGLSYILCRIVDTIEDSAWPTLSAQLATFGEFDAALQSREELAPLAQWALKFPEGLPPGEKLLLQDARELIADFHSLDDQVRTLIGELVASMSVGMQHFTRSREAGELRLRSLAEVNQYCFFVAGVVGELLAKLLGLVAPGFESSQGTLLRAHHFGLFLQKVNLLKDQVGDERVGRHLIPSREQVEDSAQENAEQALEFLLSVPVDQPEFRRFCAWALFLGLQSLNVARRSIVEQKILKVSRTDLQTILGQVEEALTDNEALKRLFTASTSRIGWLRSRTISPAPLPGGDFPAWLLELYRGPLGPQSLAQLGVVT